MNIKKIISILVVVVFIFLQLTACGTSTVTNQEISYQEVDTTFVDPFTGLKIECTGISPIGEVIINNAACSEDAQRYVEYTLDKEKYANGDTVLVTASLSEEYASLNCTLTQTQTTFTVDGLPEYVTYESDIDETYILKEVEDKITSAISKSINGHEICGVNDDYIINADGVEPEEGYLVLVYNGISSVEPSSKSTYLSTLKSPQTHPSAGYIPLNKLSFIYELEVTEDVSGTECKGILYVNVSATDLVIDTNGEMYWDNGNNSLQIDTVYDYSNYEAIVSQTITADADNYNIEEINL